MWVQKVLGGGVSFLAYAPDGRTLYTLDRGGMLSAWDTASRDGRQLDYVSVTTIGAQKGVYPLADGRRLAVAGARAVLVSDAASGARLSRFDRPPAHPHDPVRVTRDGRAYFLVLGGSEIAGWSLTTGQREPSRYVPGMPDINGFDLSADERSVAVAWSGRPATVFEWGNGPQLLNPVPLEPAADVRFAPDGRTVALSGSARGPVALWDLAAGRPRAENIPCAISDALFAFNPVLPVFAALGPGKALTLFHSETGDTVRALDFVLGRGVLSLAFAPDGLTCAVGGSNKQFAVFDVDL